VLFILASESGFSVPVTHLQDTSSREALQLRECRTNTVTPHESSHIDAAEACSSRPHAVSQSWTSVQQCCDEWFKGKFYYEIYIQPT
jgi:hypothetical protein